MRKAIVVLILSIFLLNGCGKQEPAGVVPKDKDVVQTKPISKTTWTKYSFNPVVPEGKKGQWNQWPGDPFVMKDGKTYKMWYGSHDEVNEKTQIGYAESVDGVNWNHHPNPVVSTGPKGSYDAQDVETPTVIKDEKGTYHMWYSAKKGKDSEDAIYQIAHATSQDGINWIKDPKSPVLKSGDTYGWYGLGVLEPTVIKEGGIYKIWFVGQGIDLQDQKSIITKLGYATSGDGSSWTQHNNNPLLDLARLDPSTGKVMNSAFFVLSNGKFYELWYIGGDVPDVYATSNDGLNWKKQETMILPKAEQNSWESWIVSSPTVIIDEGLYKMWYSGSKIDDNKFHFAIGYATNDLNN